MPGKERKALLLSGPGYCQGGEAAADGSHLGFAATSDDSDGDEFRRLHDDSKFQVKSHEGVSSDSPTGRAATAAQRGVYAQRCRAGETLVPATQWCTVR